MKKNHYFILAALTLIGSYFFMSCKKSEKFPTPTIMLSSNPLVDQYLVDQDGNSLYYFANDANGISNCTGGCAIVWPAFYTDLSKLVLSDNLAASDFTTITNTDGSKQTAYKGWPLYYHAPSTGSANVREKAGELTGQGVGNIWFVAKPNYTIMIANFQLTGANGKLYKSDLTEGVGRTAYFTDGQGRTLYSFGPDSAYKNKFTRADFSNNSVWPIFETSPNVTITVPSFLDASLFETTNVFGRTQMTYKGWPLYYFGQDAGIRGANKGVSVPAPGVWPVVVKTAPLAPRR